MTKSSKRIRVAIGAAGVALAVYLFYDIFRNTDLHQTVITIESVSLIGVILIFVPSIAGAIIDALGWRELLPLKTHQDRLTSTRAFWQVLRVRVASEAVVNTVPLGSVVSDPLKAWMLRKYFGISTASGIASVALRTFLLAESQSFIVLMVSIAGWGWLSLMSERFLHNGLLGWFSLSISVLALIIYTALIVASCSGSLTRTIHSKLSKIKIARFRDWIINREKYFLELNAELATFAEERRGALFAVVGMSNSQNCRLRYARYLRACETFPKKRRIHKRVQPADHYHHHVLDHLVFQRLSMELSYTQRSLPSSCS